PPSRSILDWGCGSGKAGRRVIRFFGEERFDRLDLHDHSPLAVDYASSRARTAFSQLQVDRASHVSLDTAPVGVLVLSHILNELSPTARTALEALIRRAEAVIWVEPGTSDVARDLVGFRERLRGDFRVIAPCTHQVACGLLAPENARHWCHHFASPPSEIFADSEWVKFGQRAGIDLRSLPYSFLVMERTSVAPTARDLSAGHLRVLGDHRLYKGFAKLLSCSADGVTDLTLQKRDAPDFFKTLKKPEPPLVYAAEKSGDKIIRISHEI
ncbi:MAG TPA: small ribosomal subunit Rsm22 family protein, partial [Opitutaceae bacterium]|nr:small ribosomal subunit Rsm22 family protein [Opitutaceae bacterium]